MTTILAVCLCSVAKSREGEPIEFTGRVVEFEFNRPIAGVEIVAKIRLLTGSDEPVDVKKAISDKDGRFVLKLQPDQKAGPYHEMVLSVRHPDYVPRVAEPFALNELFKRHQDGEKLFFETITLQAGVQYSGVVVRPDGTPAADVPYQIENWAASNRQPKFSDDTTGKTDRMGRFHFRSEKTRSLALYFTPPDLEPFQHYWGFDRPQQHPDYWVPNQLDRIALKSGVMLTGRVIDRAGKGIAGLRLEAIGRGTRDHRTAKTQNDGTFRFPPMRPGSYTVRAEGQGHSPYSYIPGDRSIPVTSHIILPRKLVLRRGGIATSVELREAETVSVSARLVDSHGHGTSGGPVVLGGIVENEHAGADANAPQAAPKNSGITAMNEDPPDDPTLELEWGIQLNPSPQGDITFRVPKGLREVHMSVQAAKSPNGAHQAIKTRLKPGLALRFWGNADWPKLEADTSGVEFVIYKAATMIVTVRTEDGERLPDAVQVSVSWEGENGGSYGGGNVESQKDGKFVISGLIPDQEFEIMAGAQGFVISTSELLRLPEGATREVTLMLSKKTEPAKIGDVAPPLLVKTVDGKVRSLADYQGKYLLLSMWAPGHFATDMDALKAIHKKYEGNERFAMLGLCFAFYDQKLDDYIKEKDIRWPQARFRRQLYAYQAAYGLSQFPNSVLIGPDGTILAKDLRGDEINAELEKRLK